MKKNNGFTLIEVLIAMIVLAVGLLGLAGLQATSLRNNQTAYNRSVATQLAYEIADRMRADYTEAKKLTGVVELDKALKKSGCLSKDTAKDTVCVPADMVQNDLYEWNQSIQSSLPGGTGKLEIKGTVFTITINWTENRYKDGKNVSGDTSFLMSFQL